MQVVFWRPQKYAEGDMAMSPPTSRGMFTPPPLRAMPLPAVFGCCQCRKLWYDPNTKWQNMHYTKLKQNTTLCYTTLVSVPYNIIEMMSPSCASDTHHCPGLRCYDTADHSDKWHGKLAEMYQGEQVSHCGEWSEEEF